MQGETREDSSTRALRCELDELRARRQQRIGVPSPSRDEGRSELPSSGKISAPGRSAGRRVRRDAPSNVSGMTAREIVGSANAALLALRVHAEVIGDAQGGQLGEHTSTREQMSFLLANVRHLADETGVSWDALLIEADAAHAADHESST